MKLEKEFYEWIHSEVEIKTQHRYNSFLCYASLDEYYWERGDEDPAMAMTKLIAELHTHYINKVKQ